MTEREPTSPALEASDTIGVLYDAGMYGDGEPIDRLNRILSLIERHWDAR